MRKACFTANPSCSKSPALARFRRCRQGGPQYRPLLAVDPFRTISISEQYGALQAGFQYDVRSGYTALVGPNNAGKSSLLQAIFRTLANDDTAAGLDGVALILPDRQFVEPTTQTSGMTLREWNNNLLPQLRALPLPHGSSAPGPNRPALARVLMHGSFVQQNIAMNRLLKRVGLRSFDLRDDQTIHFDDNVPVFQQGTGLRSMFPIIAALTNPRVVAVLIDEPELSLEPRLQKVLRDVLVEASTEKIVVVSTHSHLFVRRDLPEANQILRRDPATHDTLVHTVAEPNELFDVVFDLLGSSTEDLFFPANYMVVEGASDQELATRVLEILGSPPPAVKVLAARGIDAVRDAVEAVYRASVPLVVSDSPYAKRVVALVDEPKDPEGKNFVKLKGALKDRLFVLDAGSIEEYVPEAIYARADRNKTEDLAELASASSDPARAATLKQEIATALATALTEQDLTSIPTIADAARRAIAEAT